MGRKATSVRRKPELLRAIQNKQRDHFEELLQHLIGAEPTQAEIKKWAKENPASYYKSLKTASGLAGYRENADVINNTLIQIGSMSDMALEAELRKLSPAIRHFLEQDITPDKG